MTYSSIRLCNHNRTGVRVKYKPGMIYLRADPRAYRRTMRRLKQLRAAVELIKFSEDRRRLRSDYVALYPNLIRMGSVAYTARGTSHTLVAFRLTPGYAEFLRAVRAVNAKPL